MWWKKNESELAKERGEVCSKVEGMNKGLELWSERRALVCSWLSVITESSDRFAVTDLGTLLWLQVIQCGCVFGEKPWTLGWGLIYL